VSPLGLLVAFMPKSLLQWTWPREAEVFLLLLACCSSYFSLRMSRLIVLMGPTASVLSGVALGKAFDWSVSPVWRPLQEPSCQTSSCKMSPMYNSAWGRLIRLALAGVLCWLAAPYAVDFHTTSFKTVTTLLSHPRIMDRIVETGEIIDDYREGYWWLKDNTPEDARVMALWDYGYHLGGIADRTSLADGNTWNHEHIALLGLCYTSPVREAHHLVRHLADYIMTWVRDDVGKCLHMAKLAATVYEGHCAEQDCDQWGIQRGAIPTTMVNQSLVWHMNAGEYSLEGKFENTAEFEEVFLSRTKRVRIVRVLQVSEESKLWTADPGNRRCDAPGSWYCPGQYPPLLQRYFDNASDVEHSPEVASYKREFEERRADQVARLPKANGPGIPEGSYLDSCLGCSLEAQGTLLKCTNCRATGLPSMEATLAMSTCPAPEKVENHEGFLQCESKPNAVDIPEGAYRDSCLGCNLVNTSVVVCSHCLVVPTGGRAFPSSYRLDRCKPPASLHNKDGKIRCVGVPSASNLPKGGYQDSCEGCALRPDGVTMDCSHCNTPDGSQHAGSYDISRCPLPYRLDNDHGILTCNGVPSGTDIPKGSYTNSCQGCRKLVGTTLLLCSHCKAADGRQLESTYDLARCPSTGDLDNQNGLLACVGLTNADDIPDGNYKGSCLGCKLHGELADRKLTCTHCKSSSGAQIESSLSLSVCVSDIAKKVIQNIDGRLAC